MKFNKKNYFKKLFKDFIEVFNILDKNCIWWSSLVFYLTNIFNFLANDKNTVNEMILNLNYKYVYYKFF